MSKKFFDFMDTFFTLLIILSGEEDTQTTSIHHIL